VALIHPVITSPAKHNYHTRSQTEVNRSPTNGIETKNSPQVPRVVTPSARGTAPPRDPSRVRNLSPMNFSPGDFLDIGITNHAITYVSNNCTNVPMMNAFIHPATGKEMEYKDLMKDSTLGSLYKKGLGKELGRLCHGIRYIQGINTCLCVELTNITKDRIITYGKIVCNYKPDKEEKERVRLTVGATDWIILETWQLPLQTSHLSKYSSTALYQQRMQK
jgi:hypothetical protein